MKSVLCDSAKLTISGFSLSSANYKEAIDLLKQRYGNTKVLINAFMKKLFNFQQFKILTMSSVWDFFYDQVETSVRNLKTLGVEIKPYGSLLNTFINERVFVNTFGNYHSEPRAVDADSLKFIVNGKTIVIEALLSLVKMLDMLHAIMLI